MAKVGIGVIRTPSKIKPSSGRIGIRQPKAGATSVPPRRGQRIASNSKPGHSKQDKTKVTRTARFRTYTGDRN